MNIKEFSAELTALFIKAINGEVPVKPTGLGWDEAWSGNCEFDIGGYKVTFFNDCDELDYTDSAIAPDGRKVDFDALYLNRTDPLNSLTNEQHEAFEKLIKEAT